MVVEFTLFDLLIKGKALLRFYRDRPSLFSPPR